MEYCQHRPVTFFDDFNSLSPLRTSDTVIFRSLNFSDVEIEAAIWKMIASLIDGPILDIPNKR